MKNRMIYVLAIVFGLLTSYFIYDFLVKAEKDLEKMEYEKVVVTACDISAHTLLTKEMLVMQKIPGPYIHNNAVRTFEEGIGKYTLYPLSKGEQLLKSKTAEPGNIKDGLAFVIPSGKRALTVAVDEISGIAGMLTPGDQVDVVGVINIPFSGGEPYGLVVLQDIQVLAVGKTLDPSQKEASAKEKEEKTVTLAVTVEESRQLMLVSHKGAIRLMLRSPLDNSTVNTTPIKPQDFLK